MALSTHGIRPELAETKSQLMLDESETIRQAAARSTELFLAVAPRLVGPAHEGSRKSLVEGADVLDRTGADARLLSPRRHRSYLFLRYRLGEVDGYE